MKLKFEVEFTPEVPETPEEQFEMACQKVANMLDDPKWKWLRCRIADEHMSWPVIMDTIAGSL